MNHPEHQLTIEEQLQYLVQLGENKVQQQSSHQSDLLREISDLREDVKQLQAGQTEMKKTIDGWKIGGKISIGVLLALGGLITWLLNTFGVGIHIGSK